MVNKGEEGVVERMREEMERRKVGRKEEAGFFFNDTATTEIYTLSLHDALPICQWAWGLHAAFLQRYLMHLHGYLSSKTPEQQDLIDRKSTRLNSSHLVISYAVFCLKKKNL